MSNNQCSESSFLTIKELIKESTLKYELYNKLYKTCLTTENNNVGECVPIEKGMLYAKWNVDSWISYEKDKLEECNMVKKYSNPLH